MRRWVPVICVVLTLVSITCAQSLSEDLSKARNIKLLEATGEDLVKLFGNMSPFMYGREVFSLPSSRIHVSYSSGNCTDGERHGVDSEDWNVAEGKAVIVEVLPRENLTIDQLNLGRVQLRKDRLYRGRNDYHIYYNKREGIAVTTYGDDNIDSIMFFPSHSSNGLLCRDEKIQRYYSRAEWKRDPQPVYACILRNNYADVVDVEVTSSGERMYSVKTIAMDPENDVLTYNYKVTAGKVTGVGANVVWDLSFAPPGDHSITAGVDDGAGIVGKIVTKTVTVK